MFSKAMLIALFSAVIAPAIACADGGTVRCSEQRDNRRITAFTTPSTLRAGLADVSVLVQEINTGKPLLDLRILISAYPLHEPGRRLSVTASVEAATNKLLRAAPLKFSEPGTWHVEVNVQETGREQVIGFDVEVAAAPPPWLDLSLWIGWPLLAIGSFALHQWLVHRRWRFGTRS